MKLAFYLLIAFLLYIYFEPNLIFPFLGEIRAAFLISSVAFVITFIAGGRPPKAIQSWLFALLFIVAVMGLVVSPFPYTESNQYTFSHLYKSIMFYFLIGMTLNKKEYVTKYVYITLIFAFIMCFFSVLAARFGIEPLKGVGTYRMKNFFGGIGDDPNELGLALIALLPLPFCLYGSQKSLLKKILLICIVGIFLFGIFRTRSRGAFIGLVVVSIIWLWEYRREFKKVLIILLLVAFSALHTHYGFWDRMMTMKSEETIEEEYSAGSRLMQFEYCLKLMSKEPLTGVGLGNFHRAKIEMLRVSDEKLANLAAHNAYLAIGAETGIFGLLAFVLVVSCSIYYLRVSERIFKERGDTLLEAISKGTKIGLIGLSVCIFFLTEQYNLLLYQSIALSVVLRKMSLVEKDSKNNKVELLPNV